MHHVYEIQLAFSQKCSRYEIFVSITSQAAYFKFPVFIRNYTIIHDSVYLVEITFRLNKFMIMTSEK